MNPPTIPAWIDSRLQAIINAVPAIHFENSMYGPLSAYLHTLFPPSQSFMVKPQGMLRPGPGRGSDIDIFSDIGTQENPPGKWTGDDIQRWSQEVDDEHQNLKEVGAPSEPLLFDPAATLDIFQNMDDDSDGSSVKHIEPFRIPQASGPDTSIDSYGAGVRRTNKGIRYPDFIVVKATESLVEDTIALIVEVKKDDDSLTAARLQIYMYLEMAIGKRRVKFLQGLLIMGENSECHSLDRDRGGRITEPLSFSTTSTELKAWIHEIAIDNW